MIAATARSPQVRRPSRRQCENDQQGEEISGVAKEELHRRAAATIITKKAMPAKKKT